MLLAGLAAGRQRPAHLLQLGAGRHLLGEQRGLDAVEQTLQPADQLRLGDPQLGVASGAASSANGSDEPLQLLDQLGRQALLQLLDGALWISRSRCRLASSSGAAFTSSSSCRIMLPMRITLAGCSTRSVTDRSSSSCAHRPGRRPADPPRPCRRARRSRPGAIPRCRKDGRSRSRRRRRRRRGRSWHPSLPLRVEDARAPPDQRGSPAGAVPQACGSVWPVERPREVGRSASPDLRRRSARRRATSARMRMRASR